MAHRNAERTREMIRLRGEGLSGGQIARRFGVHSAVVSTVLKRAGISHSQLMAGRTVYETAAEYRAAHPHVATLVGTREIPLTQGVSALVDAADFDWLSQWKWHGRSSRGRFYAARCRPGGGLIMMHRTVLECPDDRIPDHENRNGLDNRRCNLRPATPTLNFANRGTPPNKTGFKGVHFHPKRRHYTACITCKRVSRYIGSFATAAEAARAYDVEATRLFGEFAILNFPDEAVAA